ncbi:carboxymuconolactone decarboxylase family protein [Actinoplanes sp. NPDC026619]|uniref:carboxymuconolactone decarboxylase family protein n=1 Tax=Actinoplanes sp. NPDC026619 TaxID=3155798 RepID=UPI0033C830E1
MTQRISLAELVPAGYAAVAQLEKYGRSTVDPIVLHLIKIRASVLNGCAFCIDMHTTEALADGENQRRLFAVAAWREAEDFFTPKERAALALTDAVTRIGDGGVPDDVWNEAVEQWSEEEVANLILVIGTINVWNRIVISTRTQPPPLS